MFKPAITCLVLILLSGCATNTHVSPNATISKGDAIAIQPIKDDAYGGQARLTAALKQRGFQVPAASEATNAKYLLTFTYWTVGTGSASCKLVERASGKTEVTYKTSGALDETAPDSCADAILKATKK